MSERPETGSRSQLYPVLVLVASSMAWGLTWMPLKYFGRYGLEGGVVTLVAHGSVGVLALGWLLRSRQRWLSARGAMLWLALSGGLANLAFACAIVSGDVVRVMVLFYLLPAWGVLGGALLLGERVDSYRKLSLIGALAGAFLILGGVNILEQPPSWIDLLAVLSGMALATNNVLVRKYSTLAVPDKTAAMFVGCLLWATPLSLVGLQPIPSGVPTTIWLELSAFGLVWIFAATAGTQWSVAHMEAGRSSVLIIMELVTAVASAALLNGTRLRTIEWVGGALIIGAAFLEARRPVRG
jgi:drug/metabolite transporter (DMT)-like permease